MNWKELLNSDRVRPSESVRDKFDVRTPIESDFGRAIFSSASRRLHDKTQVFPLTTDDNIHSRLTHSMEVMNIGMSFSLFLSQNEAFLRLSGLESETVLRDVSSALRTACLVHDIGNPPFGHFGEEAIQIYFKDLFEKLVNMIDNQIVPTDEVLLAINRYLQEKAELRAKKESVDLGTLAKDEQDKFVKKIGEEELQQVKLAALDYTQFDGNAEGLRVLSKLQYAGDLYGMNLTFATYGAYLKYPNTDQAVKGADMIARHKHGVFTTEQKLLMQVAERCGMQNNKNIIVRHPLSFLMEAADSICYLVMDIEDGINKKWITVEQVCEALLSKRCGEKEEERIARLYGNLEAILHSKEGYSTKKLIKLRTSLMNYLIFVAENNFVNKHDLILNGEYQQELIEDDTYNVAKILHEFCFKHILCHREIISLEIAGQAAINDMFNSYLKLLFSTNSKVRSRGKALISRSILYAIIHEHFNGNYQEIDFEKFDVVELTMEEKFRLVRDYVACMTDKFAINHNKKLRGQQVY